MGLHCEGYPPRFEFCEMMTVEGRRSPEDTTRGRNSVASPQFILAESSSNFSTVPQHQTTASADPTSPSPEDTPLDFTSPSLPSPASPLQSRFLPLQIGSASCLTGKPSLHQDIITNHCLIDYCMKNRFASFLCLCCSK